MTAAQIGGLGLALLLGAGCGGGASAELDGGSGQDAAVGQDAGGYCEMAISFSPMSPQAPGSVLVDGSIMKAGVAGLESYQFEVSFDGLPLAIEERDPYDGSKIAFPTAEIGPYRVALYGEVGSYGCADAVSIINVIDPAANVVTYRLRFRPASGHPAPIQERVIEVPGGADYSLGGLSLDNGVSTSGTVRDGTAAPLPGYLRVTRDGVAAEAFETFADPTGSFVARLGSGPYDVLVVPESAAVAPELRLGLNLGALGLLTLTSGDPISGTVVDDLGDPVVGARVALRIDGVPSTLTTTSAAGGFTVWARAGGATALTVSPVPGQGLPRLDLDAAAGLFAAPGSDLAIAYRPASPRSVSVDLTDHDGVTPAPGSRVTWIARPVSAAATITPAGGLERSASGGLRLTGVADEAGHLAAMALPAAVYDVVVEPDIGSDETVTLLEVDLGVGSPAPTTLSLAAPASLFGTVTAGGNGVGGVEVTAVPRGLLADIAGGSARAVSAANGDYTLSVVGSGEYDLWFRPAGGEIARARVAGVIAPAAGSSSGLAATELPLAVAVTGQISIPGVGGGAGGVQVMVLCYDCEGVAARIPVAEAVTDNGGRFRLAIPDPGIASSVRR